KADCILIEPQADLVLSEYVSYCLNDESTLKRMAEVVHGVGRSRLNLQEVKSIPIPLPTLEEQKEIVRHVEALFTLANAIEKRVAGALLRAEKLTQAILAKAFRGKLVPTEAELAKREGRSYEPASVLLERIRAKSEKAEPSTLSRRKPRRHRTDGK